MTTPRMAHVLLFGALASVPAAGAGEPGGGFVARHWLADDGLPNNSVSRLVRDGRGFMWLATASGLARFDGREFTEYPLPMASPDASYNIRDLTVLDERTLLMLPASGGVVQLRGREFSVHPASTVLTGKMLVDLFTEPDGTVWIGTTTGEVIRWQEGKTLTFGRAEGLTRRNSRFTFARDARGRTWVGGGDFLGHFQDGRLVRHPEPLGAGVFVAPSRAGGLWVSTIERLLRLDDDRLTVVRAGGDWRPTERGGVQALGEDASGALWIGTRRQGLARLAGGVIAPVTVPHNTVNAIMSDPEDNVWVATNGGGLTRLRPRAFTLLDASAGLPDDMSTAVCEDAAGGVWCANRAGGVVRVFEGRVQRFLRPGAPPPYAITVCPDQAGNIWVGATDGLHRVAPGSTAVELVSREQRDAHVLFCARTGDVWVGHGEAGLGFWRDGRFTALTKKDGYTRHRIKAFAEDARGALWLATDDRQVFEMVAGRLERRIGREQMPGGLIYSLHFDAEDGLWIATSRGLVLRRGERLDLLTARHGLPDEQLSLVLEDGRGRMWFGSRRGFFCVARSELLAVVDGNPGTVRPMAFGRDDGLNGASALNGMQPQAWKARDGRLWFATHGGVVGIDPAATLPSHPPPRAYLDEVLVDRVRVEPSGGLRLPAAAGEVQFKFAVPSFAAPEKVRLRHQLTGHDFGWVEDRGERRATYVRVPPGEYTLRVSAAHSDAACGPDSLTLAVSLAPAWWQTGWFRIVAVLGLAGLAGWSARLWSHRRLRTRLARLEHDHALEKERTRIARDLHDELGGSLTQIGMLADRLNRHTASVEVKRGLGDLATHTRRLAGELESIVWTVNPGNNTLDRLAAFVAQFAQRFFRDSAVICTAEGAETIPPLPLSPEAQHNLLAVVKEALNNVLKHARATRVDLRLDCAAGRFELRLADDGAGFDPAARELTERNGLRNMRTRMAEIGGELAIDSGPGRGTTVVMRLPVRTAPPAS